MLRYDDDFDRYEWIRHYLFEYANWPVPGQLKMGTIKRRYLTWNSLLSDSNNTRILTPEQCAVVDISKSLMGPEKSFEESRARNWVGLMNNTTLQNAIQKKISNTYNEHGLFEEEWITRRQPKIQIDTKKLDPNNWASTRRLLENDREIIVEGENRGRTYRHSKSRPRFTGLDIGSIIEQLLKADKTELRWNELYNPVKEIMLSFHEKVEKKNADKDMNTKIQIPLHGKSRVANIKLSSRVLGKYEPGKEIFLSDLEEWSNLAYSADWFASSSSNIQRFFGIQGLKVTKGSKRSTWIHMDHTRDLLKQNNTLTDLLEKLKDVTETINKIKKIHNSPNDSQLISTTLQALADPLKSNEGTNSSVHLNTEKRMDLKEKTIRLLETQELSPEEYNELMKYLLLNRHEPSAEERVLQENPTNTDVV